MNAQQKTSTEGKNHYDKRELKHVQRKKREREDLERKKREGRFGERMGMAMNVE